VRCSRLILEAGTNAVTVRFHPQLTVVTDVGRLERESLAGELLGALGGGRAGTHLEVAAEDGRRLAVVRPAIGTGDRVVDLATREDVSAEFTTPGGRVDLLASVGLDRASARRRLRVRATDLTAASRADELVGSLAGLDQGALWRAATNLRDAAAWLAAEADSVGADPEDAELVEEIELRHREFEAAQARHESIRHHGIFIGGASALGAVPAALLVRAAALPFLAVAFVTTMVSIAFRRRMVKAQRRERVALEAAGADTYLGFHLQRVNSILEGQEQRGRLAEAVEQHRRASAAWTEIAGDVDVEWALASRARIADLAEGREPAPAPVADRPLSVSDLASVLSARLTEVAGAGEPLPLVLDEPLAGLDATQVWELLEVVRRSSGRQVIYLTEDPEVAAWARATAASGGLSVLSPEPELAPAP
jgi:hypothetical protein